LGVEENIYMRRGKAWRQVQQNSLWHCQCANEGVRLGLSLNSLNSSRIIFEKMVINLEIVATFTLANTWASSTAVIVFLEVLLPSPPSRRPISVCRNTPSVCNNTHLCVQCAGGQGVQAAGGLQERGGGGSGLRGQADGGRHGLEGVPGAVRAAGVGVHPAVQMPGDLCSPFPALQVSF